MSRTNPAAEASGSAPEAQLPEADGAFGYATEAAEAPDPATTGTGRAAARDAAEAGTASGSRTEPEPSAPRSFDDVPGWFYNTDAVLFDWFLRRQLRLDQPGDLLEMGAYLGKSAVMLRQYLRHGETFTVCDLFGSEAPSAHNEREQRGSYADLTRRAFEANFLAFHEELPHVLQAPTSVVPHEVAENSCRFVHVDASHMYEHVRPDIDSARTVLGPDGIVVLDDYRSAHTPGVACAAWQAVLEGGLRPVCVSPQKMYGTWADPAAVQDELHTELRERGDCWLQWQEVAGRRLLLVGAHKAAPPPVPEPRHETPRRPAARRRSRTGRRAAAARSSGAGTGGGAGGAASRPAGSLPRRIAREVLPPVLARSLARALRSRQR